MIHSFGPIACTPLRTDQRSGEFELVASPMIGCGGFEAGGAASRPLPQFQQKCSLAVFVRHKRGTKAEVPSSALLSEQGHRVWEAGWYHCFSPRWCALRSPPNRFARFNRSI